MKLKYFITDCLFASVSLFSLNNIVTYQRIEKKNDSKLFIILMLKQIIMPMK